MSNEQPPGNIRNLRNVPIIGQSDPQTILLLKKLLEQAEKGDVQSIAVVAEHTKQDTVIIATSPNLVNPMKVLGGIELLKDQVKKHLAVGEKG